MSSLTFSGTVVLAVGSGRDFALGGGHLPLRRYTQIQA